jgi:hypothetical protein
LYFRAAKHGRYELSRPIGRRLRFLTAWGGLRLLLGTAQPTQDLRAADQIERIDAQCPSDYAEEYDRAEAKVAGAARRKASRSTPAPIFYIVALR